jgi:hypothetical protein
LKEILRYCCFNGGRIRKMALYVTEILTTKCGVRVPVIMKITGHSTREMFLRYDTVDATDTRKAVDQMEGFLKSVDLTVDQVPLTVKEG